MKNRIYLLTLLLPAYFLMSYSSGAPFGYSGSPGDNGRTCTQCHSFSGTPAHPSMSISGFPTNGYVPGQTYNLTLSVSNTNNPVTGFELTVEDNSHQKSGTLSPVDANTQALENNTYLTHTTQGRSIKTWNFQWTAPPAGSGSANFYYAINLANGDGNTTGDQIVNTYDVWGEDVNNVKTLNNINIKIYPNPATDYLIVQSDKYRFEQAQIIDISGKIYPVKIVNKQIDISYLPTGKYYLYFQNEQIKGSVSFIKIK